MDTIITRGVSIPRLGFGTFRMPGGGRQPVVESARETWEQLFRPQGMKNPMPRVRMVDGFNEGWIDFKRAGEHRQGTVTLDTVIAGLIGKGEAA